MKTVDWFVRVWIGDCFHETYRPQAALEYPQIAQIVRIVQMDTDENGGLVCTRVDWGLFS